MEEKFSNLHIDEGATLYTITGGSIQAQVTDLGASLVRLWVPDASGSTADVVLGYDTARLIRSAAAAWELPLAATPTALRERPFPSAAKATLLLPMRDATTSTPDPTVTTSVCGP